MFVDAPPSWDEIANTKEFQSLTPNEKANVQRRWVFDRMNYDYDRGNEIDQKAMVKEFRKNGFEPTVINTGFKDFTDYRSYMEGQQAEGLQGEAFEEASKPQLSFMENFLVSNNQRFGAIGAGLVRPLEGITGLANMTVGNALKFATGSAMGIDKLNDAMHKQIEMMSYDVEADVIGGFMNGGFKGGVNALVNTVLMEIPNQIVQMETAGLGKGWSLALLGMTAAGSKFNDIKDDSSLSEWQKYAIATTNGAIEALTEMIDTIPFVKGMTSETKQKILREAMRSKPMRSLMGQLFKTGVGEGFEELVGEGAQNITETLLRGDFKKFKDKDYWKDLGKSSLNAGIGGGVMGMGMGAGGFAYNKRQDSQRTSRKAFEETLGVRTLPEQYDSVDKRRKAIDNYDFHGDPITVGEPTVGDKINALSERILWYENIRDNIADGEEKAEWDGYYEEWLAKLDGLMKQAESESVETLSPPVNENGEEVVVTEETTEEQSPAEQEQPVAETTEEEKKKPVEKPVEEKPAEEKPKEPPRWTAEHPNHEKAPGGHYVIVDANDILVSGDKGHLPIMQNRAEGAERTAQINDMSAHPNVSKMFTEGLTDEGAPIAVMRDGKLMVVSGNGRTKARRLMATRRTDMEYVNKLQQWAKENGVEMPKGMQAPMLLRVIDEELNDEQLKDFVRQANMEGNNKLALDAAERSADDAVGMEKHGEKLIGLFTESEGDAIVSASNKEFVSKFRSLIGQRDGDVDSNGLPTDQFERRVANAFLGMLFRNMPANERTALLNGLVNHADKYGLVGLYRGLAKKAPKLIKLAQQSKDFSLDDILPQVIDAIMDFKANREQFKNDSDMYLNQSRLDGKDLKGDARDLFKLLASAKYQSQVARILQGYIDRAKRESTPDLYGETLNRGQLLQSVLAAEQERLEANGGTAVDAYLDNGSFDDADMPTVEGAKAGKAEAESKKKNPFERREHEKEGRSQAEEEHIKRVGMAAQETADRFGFPIVVHDTQADIPDNAKASLVDGAIIEAWSDSKGMIHIVADQMQSPEMAVRKVLHEIVGHNGLAALFKGRNSKAWEDAVNSLWEKHQNDIRQRCGIYFKMFDENTQEGRNELVEEWLARLAETNRKPIWWKSIVSKVRSLLRSLGLGVEYSDADIQQLLADAATAARQGVEAEGNNTRFSVIKDKQLLDRLNNEETITVYRAMQIHDGKLYPPMAGKIDGKWVNPTPLNTWMQADEFPELAKDGKFKLDKGNGTSIWAAYNPYWHTSRSPLNDQFSSAYKRPELVTVKCEVPVSELTSGYKAEGAKDAVGEVDWKSGSVSGALGKADASKTRKVVLSRYVKVVGVVPDSEVAQSIKDLLGNTGIAIPDNVVTPSLRSELDKIGVPVKESGKVKTGNRYSVAKPVQDETSPIPQGPNPPVANTMRQRAAHSPINNLRALRLPAIIMLARQLGSNPKAVDRIKRMPGALGVFREGSREIEVLRSLVEPHQLGRAWTVPQGQEEQQVEMIKDYWSERGIPRDEIEIVMKTDEKAKEVSIKAIWHDKSQTLFKKVLGHEVGHLIDYNQGETTKHGNVLGTVGGMGYKYLRQIIGETPDNQVDFEMFEKRKRELRKQAERLAGEKPKDADELKAWRETVKEEYANLLTSECEQNGWFQAAIIRDELIANTEWWSGEIGSDPNYRRYRTSPTELFAEAMSVLLNAPDKFAKQLPETWRMLQNYQKERPEFHKAWQGLMRMMNNEEAYMDALDDLAHQGYAADEGKVINIEKEKNSIGAALARMFVNSFFNIESSALKKYRAGEIELADTPIPEIIAATHQSPKDYYVVMAERLTKPLFDAGFTEQQIGDYLLYQRIVNDPSINQGHILNPGGLTVKDAQDKLNDLQKKLGKEKWDMLADWHKKFWKLRQDTIIKIAEESGMYNKELIDHMKENEWYSYRAVVSEIYDAQTGQEKHGIGKIYGLKGTLDPVGNPLGWTYDHDLRLMGSIFWNSARLKTIQYMKSYFPELVQMVNKHSRYRDNVLKGYTRLAVLENGVYTEYDVAEAWAKGFSFNLDTDISTAIGAIQKLTNLYRRAWTTFAPTFLFNNPIRDYLASLQNLSGIDKSIGVIEWTKCWAKGMKEAFNYQFEGKFLGFINFSGHSDLIEDMMRRGMFQSDGKGYDMSARNGEEVGSRRLELLRRYSMNDEQTRNTIIRHLKKAFSILGKAVAATEMGTKAGGMIALQRSANNFSDEEMKMHIVRHIGSPDFARRGTLTPITNTLFIFSNAAIQGWQGTIEMAKANPKAFATRWMATTGVAVFVQWALESGALLEAAKALIPDKDEDKSNIVALLEWIQRMYGKITHHNRYNYMSIPLAETDNGHCLAFRLPFAENSKLPAMIMHAALDEAYTKIKKEKGVVNETFDAALNQAPNIHPMAALSRDVLWMLSGRNPRDFYRGREAVKSKEWDAGGVKRLKGASKYIVHEYTPFSIINNMFDLRDNPYWWWNLVGAFGPGAWFKFQQYGEAEQSRAETAEKRKARLNGKASMFYRKAK